jgi:protein tyrosine phosphatase (PTP) superfamily phosphohydrolase (DUF442 family)
MKRWWRRLRWAVRIGLAAVAVVVGFVCWRVSQGNFAIVRPGEVYRSGQLGSGQLERAIRTYGIKTVLNLRGHNPDSAWYPKEVQATIGAGATQIDVAMSSCEWASRAQLREVVAILDTCERPVLIHCWRGGERTGLVSAMSELLRPGIAPVQARRQFAFAYLYVPFGEGQVMLRHLDQYEGWLRDQGLAHAPEVFRRWVRDGFQPGEPSRESWPHDPYPLYVKTSRDVPDTPEDRSLTAGPSSTRR